MIDLMFKASSKEAFDAWALEKGWLRTAKDIQGNDTLAATPGIDVDYIGTVVLTPAVIDSDTKQVTTPAVDDEGFFVNVRLSGEKVAAEVIPEAQRPTETVDVKDAQGTKTGEMEVASTKLEEATVTAKEFAEAATLEVQGKAEGWKMDRPKGDWVVQFDTSKIDVPWRVWQ